MKNIKKHLVNTRRNSEWYCQKQREERKTKERRNADKS